MDVYWSGVGVIAFISYSIADWLAYRRYRVRARQRGRIKRRKKLSGKIRYALAALIYVLYILVIMPMYSGSGSSMRLFIIAIVHPILVHGYFTYARLCDMLAAPSTRHIIMMSAKHTTVLELLATGRRMMLVILTADPKSARLAILVSLVEDLFTRCFLIDVDRFILRMLNVEDIKSDKFVEIQRSVWMAHENMASVSELVAIISAPIFCIVLQKQSLAFDLGYHASDAGISTPTLFTNLFVQLCGEIFVGYVATWVKSGRGIQVAQYLYRGFSFKAILEGICSGAMSSLLALYGFVRHANFLFCASSHPCDCLHLSYISERYSTPCALDSSLVNITTIEADGLLEGVDISIISTSLLTSLGMLSVVGLSVLIAKSRRQSKIIDDLERKEEAFKNAFSEEIQALVDEAMQKEQTKELWALLEPYKVPRDHITLESRLGEGSFGEVWRGKCRGQTVAVKQLSADVVDARVASIFRKSAL